METQREGASALDDESLDTLDVASPCDPVTEVAPSPLIEEGDPAQLREVGAQPVPNLLGGQEPAPRELHGAVWRLAWPSVLTMLLQTVNGLLDTLFVGHLPNAKLALTATGVGGQVIFLLISLAMGVSVGTTALVARFTGAKERANAARATGQSLALGLVVGCVVGLGAYFGRDAIAGTMLNGRDIEAAHLCSQFLGTALLAAVPLFLMNVLMAAFRGLGDTRTPLYIQVFTIATHISLNALLIYGLFGFPKMGVRGAGLALATSVYVGTALYTFALLRFTTIADALWLTNLRLTMEWAKRLLSIGIPASIQAVIRTLGMMSFTVLLAKSAEGAAGVAAMQIGIRAEAIAFMPGFGYSVAASALVGQSLGAKNPGRAERYGWAANWQGMAVMAVMAVVFFLGADAIAAVFTSDPLVRKLGADYLRVNAACEPFLALGMILTGALQGAGETLRPTAITFLTMWIIRLPLAWWLMFHLNLQTHGAWLSMTVTTIVGGLMTAALFRSGQWKKVKV